MIRKQPEKKNKVHAFKNGGRVKETGLALVHKGEHIIPAPGSEAEIEPNTNENQKVINYYFPIEVVITGSFPEEEREVIETRIWEKLNDALETGS